MRVQTFDEFLNEYDPKFGGRGLDADDVNERNVLLLTHQYSVIVEGDFRELEHLEKWIKINIHENSLPQIWYGKTDYDYGFVEYFLNEEKDVNALCLIVPNIYTEYPYSNPPRITKTNGSLAEIIYESQNKEAVVFRYEKNNS